MVFQWYIFVLIAVVALFSTLVEQTYTVNFLGQKEQRYYWLPVLMVTLPLIYWAGTRGDLDGWGDTGAYRLAFRDLPSSLSGIGDYITDEMKDKGFIVISVLIKSIIGNRDVIYFTIIAGVCIFCVMGNYKKYSCSFMMSAFLFVASGDYLQWSYNGIRQFIPVAILFACTGLLLKKKYTSLIIIILLLSTIHASTLIMIPVIFIVQGKPWNEKTILLILLAMLAIAFVDRFTNIITEVMENSQYSGEVDQYLSSEGTNIFRVLVFALPAIVAFVFRSRIAYINNPLINLAVNMSVVSFGVYLVSAFTSGLFIGRIPIYFSLYNYILLPWEIENIFTKRSAQLLNIIMIVFYLFFYYYQVAITWGM